MGKRFVIKRDKAGAFLCAENDDLLVACLQNELTATVKDEAAGEADRRAYRHTVEYASTPFYAHMQGFLDFTGEHLRIDGARMEDGSTILYFYDPRPPFYPTVADVRPEKRREIERQAKDDPELFPGGRMIEWGMGNCFGYAWNVHIPYFSEWGTAPFPPEGQTWRDVRRRNDEFLAALAEVDGGVVAIKGGPGILYTTRD